MHDFVPILCVKMMDFTMLLMVKNDVSYCLSVFERDTGVEPASQAWEARALPMC